MILSLKKHPIVLVIITLVIFSQTILAGEEWRQISPADLQKKTPTVEPDADAEAIFWEIRVDDSSPTDLVQKNYLRVKIFTERGREKYSKIDIPYDKGTKIKDIMARVIKPDGSIVELTKNEIFEREIAKTNNVKVKAKSFAVPNIEPGVIVEYKYTEVHHSTWADNMRMIFQHDIPIQNISYFFKPANNTKYLTFNMSDNKFIKDKDGFYRATMENVPAIKEESQMPPEDEVRSWLLLYYWDELKDTSTDFWSKAGGAIVRVYGIKDTLKPGKDIKTAAAQIAAGATTDEEKLSKLFEFCRTKVKNVTFDTTLTDEQKELIKPSKSVSDTYKKLQGTSDDINELFASLATALGYEARLAFGGDRSKKFFNPQEAHVSFVHFSSIAVKVQDNWKFYDPGDPFVPYGMLAWNEENTSVLLLGYKNYITTETPASGVDKSVAKRTGKFKLLEDGTLEGTVKVEYAGQLGYERRMNSYESSSTKREEDLKEEIKSRLSTAEISNLIIENVTDSQKPYTHQYKVRIPNYAQKTGKRMFLQPGFFEYGVTPLFSTAQRRHPIYFHYPWSEEDTVEIEVPKGFSLDNAQIPEGIADSKKISSDVINYKMDNQSNTLTYTRRFYFGNGNYYLFPAGAYQSVKNLFDEFHKTDSHTITLKQN